MGKAENPPGAPGEPLLELEKVTQSRSQQRLWLTLAAQAGQCQERSHGQGRWCKRARRATEHPQTRVCSAGRGSPVKCIGKHAGCKPLHCDHAGQQGVHFSPAISKQQCVCTGHNCFPKLWLSREHIADEARPQGTHAPRVGNVPRYPGSWNPKVDTTGRVLQREGGPEGTESRLPQPAAGS